MSDRASALDAVGDLDARGAASAGAKPEQHAGGDRDQRGKAEDLPVEVRGEPRDRAASDVGERQSGDAADRREQQALDQHLPQDACAPGAEREPHAHLALPPRSARQHQRGDVGTREQQDQPEKDHQHRDRAWRRPVAARTGRGCRRAVPVVGTVSPA